MQIRDIINFIENKFPLELQESYDNCGLTYGYPENQVKGILVCLDVTDEVVKEAIQKNVILSFLIIPFFFVASRKLRRIQ